MRNLELRFQPHPPAVRSEGGKPTLFTGTAVVYDQWSELLYGVFREKIAPGAFDASLASGRDLYASVDHDPTRVLGRQSSGTLRVNPGPAGIDVEVSIGEFSYARDLTVAIVRGDLRGMSFIFDVLDDTWEMKDGVPHRTVKKADIEEVSFVYFPAYPQTVAAARALFQAAEMRAVDRARGILDRENRLRKLRLVEAEL